LLILIFFILDNAIEDLGFCSVGYCCFVAASTESAAIFYIQPKVREVSEWIDVVNFEILGTSAPDTSVLIPD
jgi:hypothetical protein